jgi:hypothetical protein
MWFSRMKDDKKAVLVNVVELQCTAGLRVVATGLADVAAAGFFRARTTARRRFLESCSLKGWTIGRAKRAWFPIGSPFEVASKMVRLCVNLDSVQSCLSCLP